MTAETEQATNLLEPSCSWHEDPEIDVEDYRYISSMDSVELSNEDNHEIDITSFTIIDNHTGDVSIISSEGCGEISQDCPDVERLCPEWRPVLIRIIECPDLASRQESSEVKNSSDTSESLAPARIYRNVASIRCLRSSLAARRLIKRHGLPGKSSLLEVYHCCHCRVEFGDHAEHAAHERICLCDRPPSNKLLEDVYTPPPKEDFAAMLGLAPANSVLEHLDSDKSLTSEEESLYCMITIDDNTQQLPPALPPLTPKSQRLLLPQSSRDAGGGCGALNPCLLRRESNLINCSASKSCFDVIVDNNTESSSTSAMELRNSSAIATSSSNVRSLLNVPISSPLGQRLKRHFTTQVHSTGNGFDTVHSAHSSVEPDGDDDDDDVVIISTDPGVLSYEHFCRTAPSIASDRPRRCIEGISSFPVKFRRLHASRIIYCHAYKFTSADRRLFCLTVDRGGLNQRAYMLKKLMKKCAVSLRTISASDIVDWRQSPTLVAEAERWQQKVANLKLQRPPTIYRSALQINASNKRGGVRPSFTSTISRFHGVKLRGAANNGSVRFNGKQRGAKLQRGAHFPRSTLSAFGHCTFQGSDSDIMKPLPPKRVRSKPGDVIAISSDSEGEDNDKTSGIQWNTSSDSAGSRIMVPLLFRCHVCSAEIRCQFDVQRTILAHYRSQHNIHNIKVVKQTGPNGECLLSIMEMTSPASLQNNPPHDFTVPSRAVPRMNGRLSTRPNILARGSPSALQLALSVPSLNSRGGLRYNSFVKSAEHAVRTLYENASSNQTTGSDITLAMSVDSITSADNEVICLD